MRKKVEIQWPFVAVMGLVFSLAPFAIDMYLPALPTMAVDMATSIDNIEASVAVFLLGYAIAQLVLGPLADRLDHSKMLFSGVAVFTLASLIMPLASTPLQLYGIRLLQAFGGGASVVVFAMVQSRFDVKQSAQVISYIMAVVVLAPMVAPIVGGEILVALNWHWIFYALGVYSALALILAWFVLRSSEPPISRSKTDKPVSGLKDVVAGYRIVFSKAIPLAHVLAGSFAFAGLFAFVSGSPFVYIDYFGVTPDTYGYLVGINALAMIAMNLLNAKWLKDIHPTSKVIVSGILIGIVGMYLWAAAILDLSLPWIVIGVVLFTGLLGLMSANAIAGALSYFPDNAGTLSGVYGVAQFGIGAIFSALVSVFDSTDARTMATVMAVAAILTLINAIYLYVKWYRHTGQSLLNHTVQEVL